MSLFLKTNNQTNKQTIKNQQQQNTQKQQQRIVGPVSLFTSQMDMLSGNSSE